MNKETIEKRLASRVSKIESIDRKMGSLKNQMAIYQGSLERQESDKERAVKALDRMQAVYAEALRAEEEIVAVKKRKDEILKHYKSLPWDPDAKGFDEDPEFKELKAKQESLEGILERAEGEINIIFYGKG